jgi:hypothetical protein
MELWHVDGSEPERWIGEATRCEVIREEAVDPRGPTGATVGFF